MIKGGWKRERERGGGGERKQWCSGEWVLEWREETAVDTTSQYRVEGGREKSGGRQREKEKDKKEEATYQEEKLMKNQIVK